MPSMTEREKPIQNLLFLICFCMIVISNLVIYIAMPFNIIILEALASRCFMLCGMVSFLLALSYSFRKFMPYGTNQIILVIIIAGLSVISFQTSEGSGFYQYIIRMWCYLALPFYFIFIDFIKPEKKLIHYVFIVNILISLLFILLSLSRYSYKGYEHFLGTELAWLTLGYDNPNQTAMYLMVTYLVLLCAFFYYKNLFIKILLLLDYIYIAYLIYETHSRTCVITTIIVTAYLLIRWKNRILEVTIAIILLLPTIFMILYPYVYELIQFEYLGKMDYYARNDIFTATFQSIKHHWLFGSFSTYQLRNLHNGPASVLASLGLSGLVFFYLFYFNAYLHLKRNGFSCRTAFIAFIGLLAIFIHACTESAFLTGGSMYAGSISVLIFLCKTKGIRSDGV